MRRRRLSTSTKLPPSLVGEHPPTALDAPRVAAGPVIFGCADARASPDLENYNMQTTNGVTSTHRSLPPPLRVAPDMTSTWDDVELDFDTAAERIVLAHERDGAHCDLPVVDLEDLGHRPARRTFRQSSLSRGITCRDPFARMPSPTSLRASVRPATSSSGCLRRCSSRR